MFQFKRNTLQTKKIISSNGLLIVGSEKCSVLFFEMVQCLIKKVNYTSQIDFVWPSILHFSITSIICLQRNCKNKVVKWTFDWWKPLGFWNCLIVRSNWYVADDLFNWTFHIFMVEISIGALDLNLNIFNIFYF